MEDAAYASQYPYCISFYFDEEFVYIDGFYSGSWVDLQLCTWNNEICRASLLYHATTGTILGEGETADAQKPSEDNGAVVYTENIFMELNDIYLRRVSPDYKSNLHDDLIIYVTVMFLRRVNNRFLINTGTLGRLNFSYNYIFNMPTHWDPAIKEEFIWSLFSGARLINSYDNLSRLQFQNQVDLKLSVANLNYEGLRNGFYVIYDLKFLDNNLIVTMDLFSVYFSPVTIIKDDSPTTSIDSIYFTVPLIYNTIEGIKTCLEARGIIPDPNLVQQLNELVEGFGTPQPYIFNSGQYMDNFSSCPFSEIDAEEFGLNEDHAISVQSITLEEILVETINSIKSAFMDKMRLCFHYKHAQRWETIIALRYTYQSERCCWNHYFLFNSLKSWLMNYGAQNFDHVPLVIKKKPNCVVFFETDTLITYQKSKIVNANSSSVKSEGFLILSDETDTSPYKTFVVRFPDSNPNYVVKIDISIERVAFVCSLLGSDCRVKQSTAYITCEIPSLNQYFIRSEQYRKPILRMPRRLKLLIDKYCEDITRDYSKNLITADMFYLEVQPKIKKILSECSFDTLNPGDKSDAVEILHQPEYTFIFEYIYLAYVNNLIKIRMDEVFDEDWKEKNVGYLVSIDPTLEKTCFDCADANYLLFGCGILNEDDPNKKGVILSDEGGAMTKIQEKTDIISPVKSFVALVSINQTEINLSMYQIVKAASKDQDVSTVFIRRHSISFENTTEVLCKSIWNQIKSSEEIDCCDRHNSKECKLDNLGSLYTFKTAIKNIRQRISEMFYGQEKSLDMDREVSVSISDLCECHFQLTLRKVIDFGMKPVIQNIEKQMKVIWTTYMLFCFDMANVFITGNVFKLPCNTPLHTVYSDLLYEAFNSDEWSLVTVLQHDLDQLVQPTIDQRPYMCDLFTVGYAKQVFKYTYALYVISVLKDGQYYPGDSSGAYLTSGDDDSTHSRNDTLALIVTKKGDFIDVRRNMINFDMVFRRVGGYLPSSGFQVSFGLVRLLHTEAYNMEGFVAIDEIPNQDVGMFEVDCEETSSSSHFNLEVLALNNISAISFRLSRPEIEYSDIKNWSNNIILNVNEQITFDYF